MSPNIKPAKNRQRGVRLTAERSLVINLHDSPRDYVEIVPSNAGPLGPCLHFYNVQDGREPENRRLLMSLTVRGATHLCRYMPVLINEARRLSR